MKSYTAILLIFLFMSGISYAKFCDDKSLCPDLGFFCCCVLDVSFRCACCSVGFERCDSRTGKPVCLPKSTNAD